MDSYSDFHLVTDQQKSEHLAQLLTKCGVRFRMRVDTTNGTEYVIEVHKEDLPKAQKAFWDDFGPGREFTSR